jgi:hypothetical protein
MALDDLAGTNNFSTKANRAIAGFFFSTVMGSNILGIIHIVQVILS